MDNRPLKGNPSGNYNMNFIDPTNDICAYSNGLEDLRDLVEHYLETVTFTRKNNIGASLAYGKKESHFLDYCSVCVQKFTEGEQVNILPCKHCFHKECVMPWFQNNDKCPNCRFSIAEQQKS